MRKTRGIQLSDMDTLSDAEDPESQSKSTLFTLHGQRVRVKMTEAGLSLSPGRSNTRCWSCRYSRGIPRRVLFAEMVTAVFEVESLSWWERLFGGTQPHKHAMVVHTFHRARRKRCQYYDATLKFYCEDADEAREWATLVAGAARETGHRPHSVLVAVNPHGGSGKAKQTWEQTVRPLFMLAGIQSKVVETQHMDHAYSLVKDSTLQELQSYDGIVAVGGDGLFSEILNGLIGVWTSGDARAAVASKLRLGHIPAGSTDAVAYSLNGTRLAITAALHIVLGHRMHLDTMRVDGADGSVKAACCYAAYGYMGDIMKHSEPYRKLGPVRYTLTGAFMLLRGRSYDARITYVPAAGESAEELQTPCRFDCPVCSASRTLADTIPELHTPSTEILAQTASSCKTVEGRYMSIMIIVTPCRSDMSDKGLSPLSHLADGRLTLVLVKQCSKAEYLRFLAAIPRTGVRAGMLKYVDVINVSAVSVTPSGRESSWNVDGELLKCNRIATAVHHAVIPVFAHGVE
ncbi:hypothetical protein WJX73_000979 [Symbiochloris irregularis]|uniref:DAGKc domain-containing protein n=1 Tax=Symbiochloris irregularis TaxID=706552 RepID=A0AAW1NW18_9CHLO